MGQNGTVFSWPPSPSPLYNHDDNNTSLRRENDDWRHFDSSANAVSFGFVATAVLISMFLVMAIFERLLRPPLSPPAGRSARRRPDLESQPPFDPKLSHPSPKMSMYARGVSVPKPGEDIPTFIAHPTPIPCPPEPRPLQPHSVLPNSPMDPNLSPISRS